MRDNILRAWGHAAAFQAAGEVWYPNANEAAQSLADTHGLTLEQTAGVIAVFSPRLLWETNFIEARTYIERRETVYQCGPNLIKASLVLSGHFDAIRGPKVRPFWQAICEPWGLTPPVIDRHTICVAMGRTLTDKERKPYGAGNVHAAAMIREIQAAFLLAAERLRVHHHTLQATTWLWQRNRG